MGKRGVVNREDAFRNESNNRYCTARVLVTWRGRNCVTKASSMPA
jgi:hypothetical protein